MKTISDTTGKTARDPLAMVGLAAMVALDGCLLAGAQGTPWSVGSMATGAPAIAGLACRLLALAALLMLGVAGARALTRPVLGAATAVAAPCCTLATAWLQGPQAVSQTPLIATCALAGVATGVLGLAWCETLCAMPVERVRRVSVVGVVAGLVVATAASCLPSCLSLAVGAAALVAGASLIALPGVVTIAAPDGQVDSDHMLDYPWMTVAMFVVTGVMAAVLSGGLEGLLSGAEGGVGVTVGYFVGLAGVVAATAAVLYRDADWQSHLWVPLFCLLFLGLLVCCVCTLGTVPFAGGVVGATATGYTVLRWALAPAVVSRAGSPRYVACSFLALVSDVSLASTLTLAVGAQAQASLASLYSLAGVMALVLVIVFAAALVAYHGMSGYRISLSARLLTEDLLQRQRQQLAEDAAAPRPAGTATVATEVRLPLEPKPEPPHSPSFDEALDAICQRYDLTARELEIARLTARGNSSKHIADVLIISSSTVRFHQQNIYRKLDIHSRQEFIDLVNAVMCGQTGDAAPGTGEAPAPGRRPGGAGA